MGLYNGTRGRTRTDTLLKATYFESVKSTKKVISRLCKILSYINCNNQSLAQSLILNHYTSCKSNCKTQRILLNSTYLIDMPNIDKLLKPSAAGFKRYTGIHKSTFYNMHDAIQEHEASKTKSGRPGVLSLRLFDGITNSELRI